MRIGELSKQSGISIDTLRFYERKGLLKPVRTSSTNSYRHFRQQDLQRLDLIAKAKSLGFTLAEIGSMLSRIEGSELSDQERREVIDEKIAQIEGKMQELKEMHQMLTTVRSNLGSHVCDLD
ncbi:MerR family transcriptional regulator [Endozoicomonadaceae bacterium StTr2]